MRVRYESQILFDNSCLSYILIQGVFRIAAFEHVYICVCVQVRETFHCITNMYILFEKERHRIWKRDWVSCLVWLVGAFDILLSVGFLVKLFQRIWESNSCTCLWVRCYWCFRIYYSRNSTKRFVQCLADYFRSASIFNRRDTVRVGFNAVYVAEAHWKYFASWPFPSWLKMCRLLYVTTIHIVLANIDCSWDSCQGQISVTTISFTILFDPSSTLHIRLHRMVQND